MKKRLMWLGLLIVFVFVWTRIFPPQPYHGDFDPGFPLPAKPDSAWRLSFGSCDEEEYDQSIWKPILASKPDVWLWLGDNIYADTDDLAVMKNQYRVQKNQPDYVKLRQSAQVVGVYDDHDFGWNGANKYNPIKKESSALALDFLDEPEDSPRREQEGIYTSYTWNAAGRTIQLILLDLRYFRDKPGANSDMMGETQWKWLEGQLHSKPAPDLTLIGSSTQVFREDLWKEKWNDYPASKKRLLNLIKSSGRDGILILSGDRHHAEISVLKDLLPYPLHEVTSSGMTHYKGFLWYWTGQELNKFRVGKPLGDLNFGVMDVFPPGESALLTVYLCDKHGNVRIRLTLPNKEAQS